MKSKAVTVAEYLAEMPPDRREAIKKVREIILRNLPEGYQEVMNWGMITYQVPLEVYPDTYNGKPLMYAALANQKNHMAVYLTGIYMNEDRRNEFEQAYKNTGKRYDVGKSCVRFRSLDDLPLPLIGNSIKAMKMDEFVERSRAIRSTHKSAKY